MRIRKTSARHDAVSRSDASLTIVCAPDAISVERDSGTVVIPTSVGAVCIPLERVLRVDPASFSGRSKGCALELRWPDATVGIIFEGAWDKQSRLEANERLRLSIVSARIESALDKIDEIGPGFVFTVDQQAYERGRRRWLR
ncbi:MAG: hypothetical protein ABWY26_04005 [Microbacterium sp.]